jgi:hypothetical protein
MDAFPGKLTLPACPSQDCCVRRFLLGCDLVKGQRDTEPQSKRASNKDAHLQLRAGPLCSLTWRLWVCRSGSREPS